MWTHYEMNIGAYYFLKQTLIYHFWFTLVSNKVNPYSWLEFKCSNLIFLPKVSSSCFQGIAELSKKNTNNWSFWT